MEVITIAILRSLERILCVLFGGLLIYIGYKLFLHVPTKEGSDGRFRLPGGWGIHLTRVGPGVFFSLFGTAILIMSFMSPITYKDLVKKKEFIGAESGQTVQLDKEEINRRRDIHRKDIILLNRLADPNSEPPKSAEIELSSVRLKLAVMRTVWDEAWGRYDDFEKWINKNGGFGNVPDKYKTAMEYYKQK
jgi:hypothetical protein